MTNHDREPATGCERAEALLLEADGAGLRGEGDGPLAVHLGSCDACRRIANRILAGERALDDALAGEAAVRSVEEALYAVRQEIGRGREQPPDRTPSIRRRVAVPLLAAGLAALALWSSGPDDDATPASPVVRPAWSASTPASRAGTEGAAAPGEEGRALRVEAGGRFALMKTGSPTISVVWFY